MNFGFFVLFPVSYERSVSVNLLNNLSEENINSPITKEQLQNEIKKITNNERFLEKGLMNSYTQFKISNWQKLMENMF